MKVKKVLAVGLVVVGAVYVVGAMSYSLKPGASLNGVNPVVKVALDFAAALRKLLGGGDTVVTAGSDSHPPGDIHTLGYAVDLRTNDLSDSIVQIWFKFLKLALYPLGFDVILETAGPGSSGPHIHLEYDPKPGRALPGVPGWRDS